MVVIYIYTDECVEYTTLDRPRCLPWGPPPPAAPLPHLPSLLVPLVLSHAGEMAPDTFRMVNHLAEEKFRQLRATPDTAIRDPRADRAIYRGRIKDHPMATNSDWLGAMFNAAGLLGPPPARRTQQRHTQSSHHTSMHAGALRLLNSIQVLATQRSREQGGGLMALGGASSEPDELS